MNKLDKGINKLVKLVASISVLGFSALSLVAAALAWFASNNRVSNSGQMVTATSFDIRCEYDLYQFDPDTFRGTNCDKEGNKFNIESGDFTFLTYDSLFETRNKYTPCLLRISVVGEGTSIEDGGNIGVKIKRNTDIGYLDIEESGDDEIVSLKPTFTNAMFFKSCVGNSNISYTNAEDPNEVLNAATTYFKNDGDISKYAFTSKDLEDNWVKEDEYSFDVDFSGGDLTSEGVLYIYIYVDYNLDLIDEFTHMNLNSAEDQGGNIFSKETLVELRNDLEKIEITFTKAN